MFAASDERDGGFAHIWEMGVSMALYGNAATLRAFEVHRKPHSLLLSTILLAHFAKGYVSFCHHLASVVCRPLNFHILIFSSEAP